MADTFPWPCYLRVAHGPHEVIDDTHTVLDTHCPGVGAHPDTMIGRPVSQSQKDN